MVYLLGTNHELQHNDKPFRIDTEKAINARLEFKLFIESICSKYKIDLVAEESCAELLELKNTNSTVKEVSEKIGIEHKFCDPNLNERAEMGLPSYGTGDLPLEEKLNYHKNREKFWLEKLEDCLGGIILFVCGAEHVSSFKELLESKNQKVEVLNSYWGRQYYEI